MSTELSNGVIIPEEYSDDWYDEMSINLRKLNDVITAASDNATDIQRLDTDKANQSDLTALGGRVTQTETDITALQTAVSGKADDNSVVHTSGNETISGNKTFSSNVNIYNSDPTATTPNLYLKSSKIEISSQGNTSGDQNLTCLDKNNTTYAYIKGAIQSNGSAVKIRAVAKDSSDNSVVNELQMLAYTNGNKAIFPTYSNEVDLGVSSYKWKSFNGLNPSSLSLPATTGIIDISSYVTDLTGNTVNNYTPLVNGYIVITCNSTDVDYIKISNNLDFVSVIDNTNNQFTSGLLGVWQPCVAGIGIQIRIKASALNSARFIPCQGNI